MTEENLKYFSSITLAISSLAFLGGAKKYVVTFHSLTFVKLGPVMARIDGDDFRLRASGVVLAAAVERVEDARDVTLLYLGFQEAERQGQDQQEGSHLGDGRRTAWR